jgi:predicted enzyme related to lactoylglutathione lyase
MSGSRGGFVWYELATTDIEAAKHFYIGLLGWSAQNAAGAHGTYSIFSKASVPVGGVMGLPDEARQAGFRPGWLGYVGTDDVDEAAQRVEQLGGAVHVPPQDIPDVSRICVIVDPQTATIGLLKWHKPEQAPPANLQSPGGIGWHELLASDWESVWPFYAELLGWKKADAETGEIGTYQLFSAGGETIGGMINKPASVATPFWLYYFTVADIDIARKRVQEGGGAILNGPIEILAGRWILQCTDPQGAIFALVGKRSHHGIGYFERIPARTRLRARG